MTGGEGGGLKTRSETSPGGRSTMNTWTAGGRRNTFTNKLYSHENKKGDLLTALPSPPNTIELGVHSCCLRNNYKSGSEESNTHT